MFYKCIDDIFCIIGEYVVCILGRSSVCASTLSSLTIGVEKSHPRVKVFFGKRVKPEQMTKALQLLQSTIDNDPTI